MHKHATDYLISGVLIGVLITATLVIGFEYAGAQLAHISANVVSIFAATSASACLMFPRPILLKTLLSRRRNPFLLNEDLNAMIIGRSVGLIFGVLMGIVLSSELL